MSQDRSSEFFALAQTVPATSSSSPSAITSDGTGSIRSGDDPMSRNENPSLHRANTVPHSNVHHPTPQPGTGNKDGGAYSELREFHATASSISTDIARTSGMLSELTHLVRRRNLFVDDTDRVNHLVVSIKSNIEGLNLRLDEASATIKQRRRRMGRNSQAGQEATNLVDQLRQEFVRATKGFKAVLQQRSDGMKEAEGRKLEVFGQSAKLDDGGQRGNADGSLALGNRPPVYHSQSSGGLIGNNNNGRNAGSGGGMFGNSKMTAGRSPMMVPTLDLTSAYTGGMGMGGGDGKDGSIPAGESTSSASGGGGSSSLPRPRGVMGEGGGGPSAFGASSPYYNTVPGSPSGLRSRSGSNVMSGSGTGGGGGNLPLYSGSASTLNTPGGAGPNSVNPMMQPLTPIEIQRMEEQSGTARQMQLIPDQDYLRDRADAMSAVETNIVELGTIFNKLAVMVSEHREMVQRVEDNVEDASDNISLSLGVLTDTLDNLRTNRALFMKVFGILVVFIILFVTFFA